MKYKIVHYIDSSNFGGAEEMLFTILNGLDREKWEPVLLYHPHPGIAQLIDKVGKLNVEVVPLTEIKNWRDLAGMVRFIKELQRIRPSVFHAHLSWNLRCSHGIACAFFARVPVTVATQYALEEFRSRKYFILQKLISIFVDSYIAVSEGLADSLRKAIISANKIIVIHNGINIEKFSRSTTNPNHNLPEAGDCKPVILTIGRLVKIKGHKYLLKAATMVPDAVFVLVGEGPEKSSLEKLATDIGVIDRVVFLGQREDIPELLSSCDVFVLPSLLDALPLSVMEAMAAGKPVITTNIKGIDEIVINGKTGILVPPEDPEALADAIQTCLSDPGLAQNLAQAGKIRVRQTFSAEKMIHGISGTYEELLRDRR